MDSMESKEKLEKLYTDMYIGSGVGNPSITTRLAMSEDKIDRMGKNLNKGLWLVGGTLLALLAEIVKGVIAK